MKSVTKGGKKATMKAVKAQGNKPVMVDVPKPSGEGVVVKVVSASICGSDLHMMDMGFFGEFVIGHEFAGIAPDGRAVAVEPGLGCGFCEYCEQGEQHHCEAGHSLMGVFADGGMAEYVSAPAANLVELPTGLDLSVASLVEPLAVAVHALNRARVGDSDKVLVIGGGAIGLAVGAALQGRGIAYDLSARHPQQRAAAERLGAGLEAGEGYDVVIDAVGSGQTLEEAIKRLKPKGRIGMAGSFWEPVALDIGFCLKEVELMASMTYSCKAPHRDFEEAGRLLHANPEIAAALVTHRFPLEAAETAFATAADRASGAIKVMFDVGSAGG